MTPEQLAEQYASELEREVHGIRWNRIRAHFLAGYRAAGQVDARQPPVVAAARELARTMDEEVPWRQWPQPVLAAWEALRAALEAQSGDSHE